MEIVSSAFVLFLLLIIFFLLNRRISELKSQKTDQTLLEWLKTMQSSLDSSSNNMVKTLQENSKQLNERLDKTALMVGEMGEIGRSMKELQDFLKNPKLRGNLGEQVLKDLISQMFPKNSFHLQYQFKSGDRVDAAIKTTAGILPIDSKFPMENFQKMAKTEKEEEKKIFGKEFIRDVKKHIDVIAKKYILPEEGTMDFALMYVPSESVYYELINLSEIVDYARKLRVYIVSPNTLYVHLQTILLSFEGKKVEAKSKDILRMLRALRIDHQKTEENLLLLGKHLNNASSQFQNVSISFSQIGKKLDSTKLLEEKID